MWTGGLKLDLKLGTLASLSVKLWQQGSQYLQLLREMLETYDRLQNYELKDVHLSGKAQRCQMGGSE